MIEEQFFSSNVDYSFRSPLLYTVNRCGFGNSGKNFRINRNGSYEYCVFHWVVSGSGLLIIGGNEYIIKKGDVFMIEPKQAHIYTSNSNNPLSMMWVEFDGGNCAELLNSVINKNNRVINIEKNEDIKSNFTSILKYFKEDKQGKDANPFVVSNLLYNLICSVLNMATFNKLEEKQYPDWLQKALDYIYENYTKRLTVTDIASHIGYSDEHFSRTFSKNMGISVAHYVMLMKIEKAINLLKDNSLNVKDIASELSFNDSTHFIKSFKNILGLTPNKYRQYFSV